MTTLADTNKRKAEKNFDDKMEPKKSKFTDVDGAKNVVMSEQLSAEKIKEMMANAQRSIEERKSQLKFPPPDQFKIPQQNSLLVDARTQQLAAEVKERARVNELQARIQAKLASVGIPVSNMPSLTPAVHTSAPTPVILDDEGRTIDAKTGQAIHLQLHQPTLKANIRAKKREQFKLVHERPPEEQTDSKFFDSRLGMKQLVRSRKGFKFFEKGKFEKLGQRMRTKAQLERLQNEIATAAKKTGIASVAKLAVIQPKKELIVDEIPDVEWWDSSILKNETTESLENLDLNFEGISHLCEHPIQLKPPAEINKNVEITVMLTRKERKKLRRQNRSEIQKDIQEKIRLGLAPPPEPKVRLANLMRVLGTEAVQDPTKVEAHVRAQMAKRQKAHEDANNARALTKEQRREKKMSKIKEDTSLGVHVSIYRVHDLSNPAKKFKVETNANQLFMTGLIIIHNNCNVIVVEGGPKQQKKYRKLLMHRIKWNEDSHKRNKEPQGNQDDSVEKKENTCHLVWEGTVKNRAFGDIKFKLCPTEVFAREQFKKHGVEQYWDLAFNYSVLESLPSESF